MVGQAHLDKRRVDCIHNRVAILGHGSMQFLDDKAKEKALAEEMKKKYGTNRGS